MHTFEIKRKLLQDGYKTDHSLWYKVSGNWKIKKNVSKMNVVEMRMLRWMCCKTMRDKVRNEQIREMKEVEPIEDKM